MEDYYALRTQFTLSPTPENYARCCEKLRALQSEGLSIASIEQAHLDQLYATRPSVTIELSPVRPTRGRFLAYVSPREAFTTQVVMLIILGLVVIVVVPTLVVTTRVPAHNITLGSI